MQEPDIDSPAYKWHNKKEFLYVIYKQEHL